MPDTNKQYDAAIARCKDVYIKKMEDYGPAWRIMRPPSVTDQIFIKANRIRNLETKGEARVQEGIFPEFVGIVNYAIIGLIQLELGVAEQVDISAAQAVERYDYYIQAAKHLMMDKNHDYDEAWRSMRMSSYTDLILMKLNRTKQIEDHQGKTCISEGIDANYFDIINYAVFGLIKMQEHEA